MIGSLLEKIFLKGITIFLNIINFFVNDDITNKILNIEIE